MKAFDETDWSCSKVLPVALAIAAAIALVFYALTCFRTFTWWDSSEYSLAALTLGVPHPPGSLFTVALGWLFTRLPLGIDKFFMLNLLAAVIAALTVYLVGRISWRLFVADDVTAESSFPPVGVAIGISLGALFYGVSATTWYYAIRFTPYMTTALLTAVIVLAILAWWRHANAPNAHLWLGLVMLLFGLDFSVHRTNLLMLPGFVIWILIIHPKTFASTKNYLYGVGGLVIGLAVHLLIIPIATRAPFINFNDPSSPSRFWDYITLKQYGGGWLINMFPRKAPFQSVQIADYLKVFGDNFANRQLTPLGYLPIILGLAGIVYLYRRNWRLGLGMMILFVFSSLGAILYFNLPESFFRSIDRHYMPSFVIFAIFVTLGAGALVGSVLSVKASRRPILAVVTIILLVSMPVQAIARNYRAVDGSRSYFAYNTARNFLSSLPQNAIFVAQSDIDTYPLWCLQAAENFRPDATVCNISLMNTAWFVKQVQEKDTRFPLQMTNTELASLAIIPWRDSTIALSVACDARDYDLPEDCPIPREIDFSVAPTIGGQYILVQDQMILKILQANDWRRPLCFSTLLPDNSIGWLKPHLRLEGMYWRLIPARTNMAERDILRSVLFEKLNYQGYTDQDIPKEAPTKWIGWNLCQTFLSLASMEYTLGDTSACRSAMAKMASSLAPENLDLPPPLGAAIENACR